MLKKKERKANVELSCTRRSASKISCFFSKFLLMMSLTFYILAVSFKVTYKVNSEMARLLAQCI